MEAIGHQTVKFHSHEFKPIMRKFFLSLSMLVVGIFAFGQDIPTDYYDQLSYYQRITDQLKDTFDVVLDPIERVTLAPTSYQLDQGNWGAHWHGAVRNAKAIADGTARHVYIFVFDTGAGFSNSRLDKAWDKSFGTFQYTNDGTTIDVQGHSTHCSGIIGAVDPNGLPLGIAAEGVKAGFIHIIPVEVLNDRGSGQYSWIGQGVYDINPIAKNLIADDALVIYSFSLGGSSGSTFVDAAIQQADDFGVLIFAASGNDYREGISYPARNENIHAVGALAQSGQTVQRAPYSNYGDGLEISAAGSNILSTVPNEGISSKTGTSMACPLVAAVAALVGSCRPDLDADQVWVITKAICEDLPPDGVDKFTGEGFPSLDNLFDDVPDNPDNPDEPGDPGDPPTFSSTLTYQIDGLKMDYRRNSDRTFKPLEVADMHVTVTGQGNSDRVYDVNQSWSVDYFRLVKMVVPDDLDWGHCETSYWVGQFYEYWSRNDGIGAQVTNLRGIDDKGRNCIETTFDRATATRIHEHQAENGKTVLTAVVDGHIVQAIIRQPRRGLARWLLGK